MHYVHNPVLLQLPHRILQIFVLDLILVPPTVRRGEERRLGVHGKRDVAFVLLEQIDGEGVCGEDVADVGEEGGGVDLEVGMHIHNRDLLLNCHCRRSLRSHGFVRICILRGVRLDDGAGGVGTENIFDPDRDLGDALLEGEVVDDFAAVEG